MTARIIIERSPTRTIELLVAADEHGVILTRKEMHRDNPLDLPHAIQLRVPLERVGDLIRALEAARDRLAGGCR